jgi:non-specific serine/threonine protein kinase
MAMTIELCITPHGKPHVELTGGGGEEKQQQRDDRSAGAGGLSPAAARRIGEAFARGTPHGLLDLATSELRAFLPPGLNYARDFARSYFTKLCQTPGFAEGTEVPRLLVPSIEELTTEAQAVPPIKGAEYLTADALTEWWVELDAVVRAEIRATEGGAVAWLREKSPVWRLVGRVTFHLAENKRDPENPFAFLATYAGKLSAQAKVIQQPLGRALEEYSGAGNRAALLTLLTPVRAAAEKSALVKELVDSGDVYHPLAWTPRDAYRFLRDVPAMEESGLIVHVPDWWKAHRPPRPIVNVQIGEAAKSKLGAAALLDFNVGVSLEGEALTNEEVQSLLTSNDGLVLLKGKWVEVDRAKLDEALKHWKTVAREAKEGGVSFFEGMRLLAGATLEGDTTTKIPQETKEWVGITAAGSLDETLRQLRDPQLSGDAVPPDLHAQLRPYQMVGVSWLRFMSRLGLGACLADDMGLGKTIQVLALLLHMKRGTAGVNGSNSPSLLIVPASLIANWKAEIARFSPSLSMLIVHASEKPEFKTTVDGAVDVSGKDLVISTYGMLGRTPWLRERAWRMVILDEAQAIKNSGTRQTKAVKELRAEGRIVLTGTPVENRLSDLWSIFDFLNPGLLGSAKAFGTFAKQLAEREHNTYGPLRTLVRPYILRRMKTDKRIIADLPDKTEVTAFCGLSKAQTILYEQAVKELSQAISSADGIQRRGIVLAMLMRLKQICNHPSQLSGNGDYDPNQSGKFQRLREICEELAERQEKALVFTQFREITAPLAHFLSGVFDRPGLVLHGQTPVGKRRQLVESFQSEDGPPFFVLSLRAGGTGLNLTEASHVIHFDRWWNPAVENQATDRAFRIGQKRNVLVHKFCCRGTVEEKIDALITEKTGMARDLLDDAGGEKLLTEMSNEELMRMVSLDVSKAMET